MKLRNDKLKRGASMAVVGVGDIGCEKFVGNPRIMTAADYVANGKLVGEHIDAGHVANFLMLWIVLLW